MDAQHLLHQVGFAVHVHAVGRHFHEQAALRALDDAAIEQAEHAFDLLRAHADPGQGTHRGRVQPPVGIKGMQRLPQLVLHVVGHVHHIVDGLEADDLQPVLKPSGRGTHLDRLEHNAGIAGAGLRVLHFHTQGTRIVVLCECGHIGKIEHQ
jgi:hypothetical protein